MRTVILFVGSFKNLVYYSEIIFLKNWITILCLYLFIPIIYFVTRPDDPKNVVLSVNNIYALQNDSTDTL